MLLTSPIMIGEVPGVVGGLGVLTIVAGTFLLSGGSRKNGWTEPLRALFRERGVILMLLVAFIWSISGNMDRVGLRHCTPFWWVFFLMAGITLGLSGMLWGKRKELDITWKELYSRPIVFVGTLNALSMICYIIAIGDGFIAYVVSVKRLSIFLGICWGYLFLKEENIRQRVMGSVVMFLGLLIISFSK
jgi:uncharacterized membrane protein